MRKKEKILEEETKKNSLALDKKLDDNAFSESISDALKQKNEKVGEDARRNGYLRFVSDIENNKKRLIQAICEL